MAGHGSLVCLLEKRLLTEKIQSPQACFGDRIFVEGYQGDISFATTAQSGAVYSFTFNTRRQRAKERFDNRRNPCRLSHWATSSSP